MQGLRPFADPFVVSLEWALPMSMPTGTASWNLQGHNRVIQDLTNAKLNQPGVRYPWDQRTQLISGADTEYRTKCRGQ